jgi:hypothetical protein
VSVGLPVEPNTTGLLILLSKKISLKALVKKRAFLTIGGRVDSSTENLVVVKKTPSSLPSSLLMGFSHSRYIGKFG